MSELIGRRGDLVSVYLLVRFSQDSIFRGIAGRFLRGSKIFGSAASLFLHQPGETQFGSMSVMAIYLQRADANRGHPVNDRFDLRMTERPHENHGASAAVKSCEPVEKASRQGIECRQGGSDRDRPLCDSRPISVPERTDLVEGRKGHRTHGLRRCRGRELHKVIQ